MHTRTYTYFTYRITYAGRFLSFLSFRFCFFSSSILAFLRLIYVVRILFLLWCCTDVNKPTWIRVGTYTPSQLLLESFVPEPIVNLISIHLVRRYTGVSISIKDSWYASLLSLMLHIVSHQVYNPYVILTRVKNWGKKILTQLVTMCPSYRTIRYKYLLQIYDFYSRFKNFREFDWLEDDVTKYSFHVGNLYL